MLERHFTLSMFFVALATAAADAAPLRPGPAQSVQPTGLSCASALRDQAEPSSCLRASSTPELGHLYPLSEALFVAPAGVGIGTTSPDANLEVRAAWSTQGWGQANIVSRYSGDTIGVGLYNDLRQWDLANIVSGGPERFVIRDTTAGAQRFCITAAGNVGIGTQSPSTTLDVNGAITIRGGSDLAEPFAVLGEGIQPGLVLSIDPGAPGSLRPSAKAYDRAVAGVISGAGDLDPGLILSQGPVPNGQHPVALSGRVWAFCDASFGPIAPGDLLTTSPTEGHAMRASDGSRTAGAVLGKAFTTLDEGRGLVLVLVSLQ